MADRGRGTPSRGSASRYRVNKNSYSRTGRGNTTTGQNTTRDSFLNTVVGNSATSSSSNSRAGLFASSFEASTAVSRPPREPGQKLYLFGWMMKQFNDAEAMRKNPAHQTHQQSVDTMDVDSIPNRAADRFRAIRRSRRPNQVPDSAFEQFLPPDALLLLRQTAEPEYFGLPRDEQPEQFQGEDLGQFQDADSRLVEDQLPVPDPISGEFPAAPVPNSNSMLVSPEAKELAAAAGLPECGIDRFPFLKNVLETNGLPLSRRSSIESLLLSAILDPLRKVVVEAQWGQAKISGMVGGMAAVGPFMGDRNEMWNNIRQYVEPIWKAVYEHETEGKEIPLTDDFKTAQEYIRDAVSNGEKKHALAFGPPGESIHVYNEAAAKQGLLMIQGRMMDWVLIHKNRAEQGHKKLQAAITGILQHPKVKDPVDQQAPETSGLRSLASLASVLLSNLPQVLDSLLRIMDFMVSNANRVMSDSRSGTELPQAGRESNARAKNVMYHNARIMESVVIDAVFPCFVVRCLREFKRHYLPSFAFFDGNAEEWWSVMQDLHFVLLQIFHIDLDDPLACLPTGVELEEHSNLRVHVQDPFNNVDATERSDPLPSTDEADLPPDWLDPVYESLYGAATDEDNRNTLREALRVELPKPTEEEERHLIDYSGL
ncbi:hypothetical protein PV04_03892 [Phialophora macrospora]|uniref:Uncharacterized protein n=1 Tax=Phialophora macrospora TaxID=1851006 RepID=A0A0D2FTK1_9EURO|nr:hypothetical protein PV04_03892 [Phialophora macrospora]